MDSISLRLLRGHVIDDKGGRRLVNISCMVVPGLERNLVQLRVAVGKRIVSMFNINSPHPELFEPGLVPSTI